MLYGSYGIGRIIHYEKQWPMNIDDSVRNQLINRKTWL